MKKNLLAGICLFVCGLSYGQTWSRTSIPKLTKNKAETHAAKYYTVDVNQIRSVLSKAADENGVPVIISLPTLDGKIERFSVYSNAVVEKSMADRYELGSYVGVGIDDPEKYLRFSTAPNDFQSMIIKNGQAQFIEPMNASKTVYGVFLQTNRAGVESEHWCGAEESSASKVTFKNLFENTEKYIKNDATGSVLKSSDSKYRTYRLALSVTGEYTQYFGGKAQAAAAMNATMTRVNGIYEKELAVHFTVLDIPSLIYENSDTDPYSVADFNDRYKWLGELYTNLSSVVGNHNYEIGHLLTTKGVGTLLGVGDIGSVCMKDSIQNRGGFSAESSGDPQGDKYDIGTVAHEIGHQLSANHIFSQTLEPFGKNIEPGSGDTIMGYGLPRHTYFNGATIDQIQAYLSSQPNCGLTTEMTNQPPSIEPMGTINIPKGTAFILTASATDPEGDALSYNWEQDDNAESIISVVTGNNVKGVIAGSKYPVSSTSRSIPSLKSVVENTLTNVADKESVSYISRELNFRVTARDNNVNKPQTNSATQKIIVGQDGPFQFLGLTKYGKISPVHDYLLKWDIAGTNAAPYNSPNIKVDYTKDKGITWTDLFQSTSNDGSEIIPAGILPVGKTIQFRASAVGNIFYTVSVPVVYASDYSLCDGSVPQYLNINSVTTYGATVEWVPQQNGAYRLEYKKSSEASWKVVNVTNQNSYTFTDFDKNTQYEVRVATTCSGALSTFSEVLSFTTLDFEGYCVPKPSSGEDNYISNVALGNVINNSGESTFSNYFGDLSKKINLVQGSVGNVISVTKHWYDAVADPQYDRPAKIEAWIDFNRNGVFESEEIIMSTAKDFTPTVTATFSVPGNAYSGESGMRMRVAMKASNGTFNESENGPCGKLFFGEVEDYLVVIRKPDNTLHIDDLSKKSEIQFYPNPADDYIKTISLQGKAVYQIYGLDGRMISSGNVINNTISVSNLIKGIYILMVTDTVSKYSHKFIKN